MELAQPEKELATLKRKDGPLNEIIVFLEMGSLPEEYQHML